VTDQLGAIYLYIIIMPPTIRSIVNATERSTCTDLLNAILIINRDHRLLRKHLGDHTEMCVVWYR